MKLTEEMYQNMDREIPVLTAEIRALYNKLDKDFGLDSSHTKIKFGYKEDSLGSYTPAQGGSSDYFEFSLLFIARCVAKPLIKEDRVDLFLHEYAHFMQFNMEIPKDQCWQPGIHGSAWKYCCSLVGAAPTPYYRVGEGLLEHDYDSALSRTSLTDRNVTLRDNRRREKEYQASRDRVVQYSIGDEILHPTYGPGTISDIKQTADSVRLYIDFSQGQKVIDQKWLIKNTKYRRAGD